MTTATTLEADPLWNVRIDGTKMGALERELFFQTGAEPCGEVGHSTRDDHWVGEPGHWTCTRGKHPDTWRHIATRGYRGGISVIAAWGGQPPTEQNEPTADVAATDLTIGRVYKFKNKKTPLLLVGHRDVPQGGGAYETVVEVLDLEHQRYRVLKKDQIVLRPADAEPLTQEQTRWVAQFMVERREKVREIALQQRREGRFGDKSSLDKVLVELEMEPTVRVLQGEFTLSKAIRAVGVADATAARRLLKEWMKALPPLPQGLVADGGEGAISTNLRWSEG